jgi:hypothetical protein
MRRLVLFLFLIFSASLHAKRIFVDNTALTGLNNGSTWVNAYLNLDTAFAKSLPGDTLWVAAGRYYTSSNRDVPFNLPNKVSVFGSFNKTEADESERKFTMYKTYLDGDIGVKGNTSDNSRRILSIQKTDSTTIFDGFHLVNANNDIVIGEGAALRIDSAFVSIRNCVFQNNQNKGSGAGVYATFGQRVEFISCSFINNAVKGSFSGSGGACYILSNCSFQNCIFNNNSSAVGSGGACQAAKNVAFYDCKFSSNQAAYSGALSLINKIKDRCIVERCIFSNNISNVGSGAAISFTAFDTSSIEINNSLFVGNYAKSGNMINITDYGKMKSALINNCTFSGNKVGGTNTTFISATSGTSITNSIFWDNAVSKFVFYEIADFGFNPQVKNCIVEGGSAYGQKISNLNPGFIKPKSSLLAPFKDSGLNYRLNIGSFAIDGGDSVYLSVKERKDLDLKKRVFNNNIDFGSYESTNPVWIIAVKDSLNGGLSTGFGSFPKDSMVVLVSHPFACSNFYAWMENGKVLSTDSVFKFKADKNRKITAVYPYKRFALNALIKNGALEGKVLGVGTYNCNDSLKTLTAIPDACYRFVEWRENGFSISTQAKLNVKLKSNREFEAVFEKITSKLTLSTQPINGGTVTGAGTFNCKSPVQVGVKANPGFVFFAWLDMANGYIVSKDSNYSFSINSDRELRAWFHVNTGIESPFKSLGFYPNPCHDYLYLQSEINQYQIFNAEGQLIKVGVEQTIDVKNLLPGMYLLEVYDASDYKQRFKFVKE